MLAGATRFPYVMSPGSAGGGQRSALVLFSTVFSSLRSLMRVHQCWKVPVMSGFGEELEEAGKMSLMSFYYFLYTILGNFQHQETEHPNIDWEGRRR